MFKMANILAIGPVSLSWQQFGADLTNALAGIGTITGITELANTLSFSIAEYTIRIGSLPVRVPELDLLPAYPVSLAWPTAEQDLKEHNQQLLVCVYEGSSDLESIKVLTMAVGGVLASCTCCIGVYWCDAEHLISKEVYLGLIEDMKHSDFAIPLWISFRLASSTSGNLLAFTKGMETFGLLEVEVNYPELPALQLVNILFDTCDYEIGRGSNMRGGDRVAAEDDRMLSVTIGPSSIDSNGEVLHLTRMT